MTPEDREKTILSLKARRELPRELHVEGTNACNARCVFCAYPSMQRPRVVMPMPKFRAVVDQYIDMGGRFVSLTPIVGDPFVDPHLFERLDYLKSRSEISGVQFFTNAILMRPAAIERLLSYGELLTIRVSLGGVDPSTYRQLMGVDAFDGVWTNLGAFISRRGEVQSPPMLEVHMRCPRSAMRGPNWDTLKEFEEHGFLKIVLLDEYDSWTGTISPATLQRVGLTPKPERVKDGPCELLFMRPVVLADGRVNACGCRDVEARLIIGDLGQQLLKDIWNGDALDSLIDAHARGDYPDVCRRCTYYVSVYDEESWVHRGGRNWSVSK